MGERECGMGDERVGWGRRVIFGTETGMGERVGWGERVG